jgi:hypothetical protein
MAGKEQLLDAIESVLAANPGGMTGEALAR